MQEFIQEHGITASAVRIPVRPDALMSESGMIHWLVTLSCNGKEEAFYFSHGYNWLPDGKLAHPFGYGPGEFAELRKNSHRLNSYGKDRLSKANYHKPAAIDVLPSLQMDCSMADEGLYMWEFFDAFGMEPSEEGEEAYNAVVSNAKKLQRLFGYAMYNEFLALEEDY